MFARIATLIALGALAAALSLLSPTPACAGDCGIVPIKPIAPIGCTDLKPECVCDQTGQKCYWRWVCVK